MKSCESTVIRYSLLGGAGSGVQILLFTKINFEKADNCYIVDDQL